MKYTTPASIAVATSSLCLLWAILPMPLRGSTDHAVHEGIDILQQLSEKSVASVDKKIEAMDQRIRLEELSKQPLSVRFQHSLVMGDSLAEAFLDYQLLNSSNVLAIRGRRTDNIDAEIAQAIQLAPRHIFLSYGMNDLLYCRGDADRFVKQYQKQIHKLKQALPDTKIYICSLIPIDASAIVQSPDLASYTAFNKELQKMCEQEHIHYIDNTTLMDWSPSVYEADGIHPKYPYYPIWLAHMASEAGL